MTDFMTPEQRHNNMRQIKSFNTVPEVYIRSLLFAKGYRYRIQSKQIPGRPDIWMRKYNTAIFINGCFWHRHHNCKYAYMPKSRVDFWQSKFLHNIERDREVKERLQLSSIKCLVIWECTVKQMRKSQEYTVHVLTQIDDFLRNNVEYLEL